MPLTTTTTILRRAARLIARVATRYVTDDAFEIQRCPRSPRAEVVPASVYGVITEGIEVSFNRVPMYAGIARALEKVELGDVVEFGGANSALPRLLKYRTWNVAPNYPEVDVMDLHNYVSHSYDTVVLDNILEHVSEPARAVAECARLLRPVGRFIAAVPFLVPVHPSPTDYTRWTPAGLEGLLRKSFAEVDVYSWGNREALKLLIDSGAPEGWPTFLMAKASLGDSRAWLLLQLNEPEWPITIWAVAKTAAAGTDA